jgi:hypothetical protein
MAPSKEWKSKIYNTYSNRQTKTTFQICDIQDPEELKTTLVKLNWSNNTKRNIVIILTGYLRFIGKE